MTARPFTVDFGFKTDSDSAALAGSKPTVIFYIFFTKRLRWRQGSSLPVLVLKPVVIGSITVGCSNRHKRPHSLSVFKLKPTVMCRCSSHANSAPTDHNNRKTAPTYPDNFSSETKMYHEC